jgi:hypothetical protein
MASTPHPGGGPSATRLVKELRARNAPRRERVLLSIRRLRGLAGDRRRRPLPR